MKHNLIWLISAGLLLCWAASASAQQNLADIVVKGCQEEIEKYCKDVTPGDGRVLACLYAHNDRLSGKCEFALYDAAAQLERAVAALTYVANECENDLDNFCKGVDPGEERLLKCLEKQGDKVSKRCREAIEEVGLKKK